MISRPQEMDTIVLQARHYCHESDWKMLQRQFRCFIPRNRISCQIVNRIYFLFVIVKPLKQIQKLAFIRPYVGFNSSRFDKCGNLLSDAFLREGPFTMRLDLNVIWAILELLSGNCHLERSNQFFLKSPPQMNNSKKKLTAIFGYRPKWCRNDAGLRKCFCRSLPVHNPNFRRLRQPGVAIHPIDNPLVFDEIIAEQFD